MKKLLLLLTLAASTAYAAVLSGNLTSALANPVASTALLVNTLTFVDTSGSANLVYVLDNTGTSSTNLIRPAYTSRTVYSTNIVTSFTDKGGVATLQTNSVLASVNATVAATTNVASIVYIGTIPANGTLQWAPDPESGLSLGMQIKAAGTAAYSLVYRTLP